MKSALRGLALSLLLGTTSAFGQTGMADGPGAMDGSDLWNLPHSTTLPATCAVGDIYADSDAPSGARIYLCESANTWVAQGGSGTVTTTGTLASGQVALGSGATSITSDAGCTWTGTGASFLATMSGLSVTTLTGPSGVVQQRSGATAQAFEVHSSYTDASNFRKLIIGYSAYEGLSGIWAEGLGTGADPVLYLGTKGAGEIQMLVSGSTTLRLDGTHLYPPTALSNGIDIGYPGGSNSFRTGYFGTSVVTPSLIGIGGSKGQIDLNTGLTLTDNVGNAAYWVNGALYPYPTATMNLGQPSLTWGTLFTANVSGGAATGTNTAGANLTIQPRAPTGNATPTAIVFKTPSVGTSGTTAQTQTTRLTLSESAVAATGLMNIAAPTYGLEFPNSTQTNVTGASYVAFKVGGAQLAYFDSNTFIAQAPLRLAGYTVATLPAGTVGDTAYVTDATAPTYLGALTGGGAVTTPVFYNGAAWVSH